MKFKQGQICICINGKVTNEMVNIDMTSIEWLGQQWFRDEYYLEIWARILCKYVINSWICYVNILNVFRREYIDAIK